MDTMLPFIVRRALDLTPFFLAIMLWPTPAASQGQDPCSGVKCPANASCHETEAGHACLCNRGYLADPHNGTVCLRDESVPLPDAQLKIAATQAKTGVVLGFMGAGFTIASEIVFWASAFAALGCILSSREDCGPSQPLVAVHALHITGMALLTMGTPLTYMAQTRALSVSGAKASPNLKRFWIATWVLYSLSMASFALWFIPKVGYIAPIIGEVLTLTTTVFGIVGWNLARNISRKELDDPPHDGQIFTAAIIPVQGGMMISAGGIF